jgi:hypothetical protein
MVIPAFRTGGRSPRPRRFAPPFLNSPPKHLRAVSKATFIARAMSASDIPTGCSSPYVVGLPSAGAASVPACSCQIVGAQRLSRQCLDRRIPDKQTLIEEVAAWEKHRNQKHTKADWQFTTADARIKLKCLYLAL